MGSEFLSEEYSQTEVAPPSYVEEFYKAFPQYLAMGMTAEEFWDGDCTLPKYYREAHRLKQEHENYSAWLQGAYVYDAFCAAAPILHAFATRGTKPLPYHTKPYELKGNKKENAAQKKADFLAKWKADKVKWRVANNIKGGETDADTR